MEWKWPDLRPQAITTEADMSEDDDKFGFIEWDSRAREIVRDLTRDGYPESDQIVILTGCLCMVIAKGADDEGQLMSLAASARGLIGLATDTWFKPQKGGERTS